MSNVKFNHSNADGHQTISVFITKDDGETIQRIVAPSNPSFKRLAEYFLNTPEDEVDAEHVHGLVDPAVGIGQRLREAFGDRVTFDNRTWRIDGVPSQLALANHVRDKVLAGDDDWERMVRFLVNVEANPSYSAQQFLWGWVESQGLTITEDGRILGYKGVDHDGLSMHSGPNNFINGVLYKNGESTRVPHEIGSVVSKRRQDVDDSPMACSTGLHVGSEKYARSFGPRLMTVIFNPADVVGGDQGWKIRVSKYEVHSLAEPEQFAKPSYDAYPTDSLDEVEEWEEQDEEDEEFADVVQAGPHLTLAENADLEPDLKADLENTSIGHKPLARKWSHLTTESSVRRYRKANGINLSLGTKVKDAFS